MRRAAQLTALLVVAVLWAHAQTEQSALQQRLNSQFQLTQLTSDRSNVKGNTGSTLRLNKDGLVMYATSSPMPSSNTYKNGKISQGGGGFGRDLAITMAKGGQGTANDEAHHKFAVNDEVWVIKIDVHPTDVTLRLCSNPGDGMLYYGDLKVPFDKGSNPTPDQVLARIGEVLTAEQPEGQAGAVETAAAQTPPQASSAAPRLPALYVNARNPGDQLKLNADNSFVLQEHGQTYHGTFTEKGNGVALTLTETHTTAVVNRDGDDLLDPSGFTWKLVKTAQAQTAQAQAAPAALKLPALYVNSKNAGDQLKLNADKSFLLKEDGQPYHGTFTEKGNSLELSINETNTTTVVTLQGNSITDTSGHTWTLHN